MKEPQQLRIGQLIEHIHTKDHALKKALASHATGSLTDVDLFKRLNEIAAQDIPKPPPGYSA